MALTVRFWGTRGSIPSPGPTTVRYGGNTPCVEVRTEAGWLVILDAGTGIRELGRSLLDRADGTPVEGEDLLFAERAFWLYATGHRLSDMRRLLRAPYSRAEDTVFPTGDYHKGGSYGSDVNLPIPIEEENNPTSVGCLDRNP